MGFVLASCVHISSLLATAGAVTVLVIAGWPCHCHRHGCWRSGKLMLCEDAALLLAPVLLSSSICICASCSVMKQRWHLRVRYLRCLLAPLEILVMGLFQFVQLFLAWYVAAEDATAVDHIPVCHASGTLAPPQLRSPLPTHRPLLSESSPGHAGTPESSSDSSSGDRRDNRAHSGYHYVGQRSQAATSRLVGGLYHCPQYHAKGLEGILEGAFSAWVLLFVLLIYPARSKGHPDEANLAWTTPYLWTCVGVHFFSAVMAAMEVDHRLAWQANRSRRCCLSIACFARRFIQRSLELASRLWVLGMMAALTGHIHELFFPALVIVDFMLSLSLLLHYGGCEPVAVLSGLATMAVNVVMEVQHSRFAAAARRLSWCLLWLRLLEVASLICALEFAGSRVALEGRWYVLFPGGPVQLPDMIPLTIAGVLLNAMLTVSCRHCCSLKRELRDAAASGDTWKVRGYCQLHGVARLVLNRAGRDGLTPLHLACHCGSVGVISVLLHARADATVQTQTLRGGETPLMLAAGQGHAEAVRHLLRHGARQTLALHSRVTGDTALHLAGRSNHTSCVHALLLARADPDAKNLFGQPALGSMRGSMQTEGSSADSAPVPVTLPPSLVEVEVHSHRAFESAEPPAPNLQSVPLQCAPDHALQALLGGAVLQTDGTADTLPMRGRFISSSTSRSESVDPSPHPSPNHRQSMARAQHLLTSISQRRRPVGLSTLLGIAGGGAMQHVLVPELIYAGMSPHGRHVPSSDANSSRRVSLECFKILRQLGEGNFGNVYEVVDLRHQSERAEPLPRYALKILHNKQYKVEGMMERARQEHYVLKAACHPFIVRLVCAFRTQARELVFVMELCPNGDLNNLIIRKGQPGLSHTVTRKILAEILLALQYLHDELKVIFRDLKPENVVLDAAMRAKLTDFGLAKEYADSLACSFLGTPQFLAPEVKPWEDPYTFAVDLYDLGLVAWVCLTGGQSSADHATRLPHEDFQEQISAHRSSSILDVKGVGAWTSSLAVGSVSTAASSSNARASSNQRWLLAMDLIQVLTSIDPEARGSAKQTRSHPFFVSGSNPALACDADWEVMLPTQEPPAMFCSEESIANDSWFWRPKGR